ncbi:nucleoside-diphosphate sugar epimerase/dehydratase [Adlercreutzia sp. ZJ473]|uniref:polysaccharide biosynthesis protein n=1 Tax=Adlercreutzia sp. ZJ473 TaxID=2722822 RepID=UPI001C13094E
MSARLDTLLRALPLVVLDVMSVYAAFVVGAWGMHLEGEILGMSAFGWHVALLALVYVLVLAAFRMYTTIWRYASVDELVRVVLAVTAASLAGDLAAALLFGERLWVRSYLFAWLFMLVACGASRFAARIAAGAGGGAAAGPEGSPRTLVVGAGENGSIVVKRMLAGDRSMPGLPVGLVDDDPAKVGRHVHGVRVLGTCDRIPELCGELGVEQLVISIPNATRSQRGRIYDVCAGTGVRTMMVPYELDVATPDAPAPIREVEIADLLARDEVALDLGQVGYVTGRRVLVTGGGGSIGSEIARQLLPARPAEIILLDVYENTTYELYHEIRGRCEEAGVGLSVEIGSITHLPALEKCFGEHAPDVVFHAAAHKHVPLMEANAREAVENNVLGTLNVARMAHERGCTHFVLVSTDKAVNPANVMGATKRMCEMVVQRYAAMSDTVFAAVRFGNVLGSHGSVIPLFKRQLREGGPVTVTHRDITRYFMTIPEASRLVITAGALAKGGEIFVLDMGEPVRIWDLAENLVRLSGLVPGRDVDIVETGLRPGEKMYEELRMGAEEARPTSDGRITVLTAARPEVGDVGRRLEILRASLGGTNDDVRRALAEAVPTYHPDLRDDKEGSHAARP